MSGKRYSEDFKRDAVKLILEQGYSYLKASKNLGVNKETLRRWVELFADEVKCEAGLTKQDLIKEIQRLRKKTKKLEEEKEILKKAAAFFAKEAK